MFVLRPLCTLLVSLIASSILLPALNVLGDDGPPATASAEPTLITIDGAAFDKLLAEHRGQVILVDFWATWCSPCIEQLPHTAELYHKHAGRGLVVITVSLDEPDDQEPIIKVLEQHQLQGINLISQHGAAEQSFTDFEITGRALPHYKLYDRRGDLVRTFNSGDPTENPFTPEEVDVAIRDLLRTPPAARH